MDTLVTTYCIYLALSIALTVWVAHTLHKNGRVFLVDVFHGRTDLADSVNHLLVVGFYLVNLGFVCAALKVGHEVSDTRGSIETLSVKIGLVLLVLGIMHFFNLAVFTIMRRSGKPATADLAPRPPHLPGLEPASTQLGRP